LVPKLNTVNSTDVGGGVGNGSMAPRRGSPTVRWLAGVLLPISLLVLLPTCGFVSDDGAGEPTESNVATVAGWTRIATTTSYIVVANVLPGEEMFTAARADAEHPVEGELILAGSGDSLGADVRHVEAHIYDRETGLPSTTLKPTISLLNRTTGERTDVRATLMQDVNIGGPDVHYGNNVHVHSGSDLTLTITIGDEEVTLDGHLD
jgi:hypothetical protein